MKSVIYEAGQPGFNEEFRKAINALGNGTDIAAADGEIIITAPFENGTRNVWRIVPKRIHLIEGGNKGKD